jgi:hypothetical protein
MSIFQASVGTVEVQLQFLGKVFSPVLIEVGWNGGSRAVTLFASHGEVNVPEWPPVWLNAEPRDCSLQRQRIHIQERAEATEDRVLSVVVVIGLAGTVVVSTVDSVSGLPIKGHYVEASTIGGPWQQMHGITSLGGVHTFCGLSVGDWEIVAPAWREYKQTDHTTLRVIAGESRDIKLMISPSASPCIKGRLEGLANSGATDGILNRYRLDRGDKIGSHVIYDDGAFYIFEIIDGHAKVRVIDEENARKSQWMMLSEGDNGKLAVIW